MLLALVWGWVIWAVLVGAAAHSRGRSGWEYFFAAVLLSPLVVGIYLLLSKSTPAEQDRAMAQSPTMRKCPHCAEFVKREATRCRYCQQAIAPLPAIAPASLSTARRAQSTGEGVRMLAFSATLVVCSAMAAYAIYALGF